MAAAALPRPYQPIHPWQTRLLRLHPAVDHHVELSGDLVVVDMTVAGPILHQEQRLVSYTALSYSCGELIFPNYITLNGDYHPITTSLYKFLRRYRCSELGKAERYDYVWIDAISVDQLNLDEKNAQVPNIRKIYELANVVLVWLGDEIALTADAIAYLKREILGRPSASEAHGLIDLYTRPWFERLWVRQEMWAARHIRVLCGMQSLWWRVFVFSGIKEDARQYLNPLRVPDGAIKNFCQLRELIESSSDVRDGGSWQRPDLLTLLATTSQCKSLNILDRVFALVGLSREHAFPINYHLPPAELFESLARYLIDQEFDPWHILDLHEHGVPFGPQADLLLPSWVPDWRAVPENDYTTHRRSIAPSYEPETVPDALKGVLSLRAIPFCTLTLGSPGEVRGKEAYSYETTFGEGDFQFVHRVDDNVHMWLPRKLREPLETQLEITFQQPRNNDSLSESDATEVTPAGLSAQGWLPGKPRDLYVCGRAHETALILRPCGSPSDTGPTYTFAGVLNLREYIDLYICPHDTVTDELIYGEQNDAFWSWWNELTCHLDDEKQMDTFHIV